MPPDLIRSIAEAVVHDQFLMNWKFYVLLTAIFFVGSAGGHVFAAYFKKRGETLATKSDMDEILRQVSETTRATERVRSEIAQADWAAREWNSTRRLKLEELLSTAYSLDLWMKHQQSEWIYADNRRSEAAPMERLKLLATLYFPELQPEVSAVWFKYQEALVFILAIGKKTSETRRLKNAEAHQAVMDELVAGWRPLQLSAQLAIGNLEKRAATVMLQFAAA